MDNPIIGREIVYLIVTGGSKQDSETNCEQITNQLPETNIDLNLVHGSNIDISYKELG